MGVCLPHGCLAMDVFILAPFVMEPQNMEEPLGLTLSYTILVTHVQRSLTHVQAG